MMVKICGITQQADATVAVEAGATAIGFNFYLKSPRYITAWTASMIDTATLTRVGIFVNEPPESVAETMRIAGLDVAQLYGRLQLEGARIWRARHLGDALDDAEAEAFLLDTPSDSLLGGTGETFDWSRARGLGKRIILAGGLDASNVREAIEQAEPWGVDACSRLESAPGRKDPVKVREFIKAALSK